MKEYLSTLRRSKLFEGTNDEEILSMLKCLNAVVRHYKKDGKIFSEGASVECVCIVISGEVQTRQIDYNGNISIVSKLFPSDSLAAVAAFSSNKRLPFDAVAVSDCEILCLDNQMLTSPCRKSCGFHSKLINNMLTVIADKNMQLSQKINILTKRTLREKVLTYLYMQSKKSGNVHFSIDLTRRQMAEYLSINRSALSRELSKMCDEGILSFENNVFTFK